MSDIQASQAVHDAVARAIGRPVSDNKITVRPATAHPSNRLHDIRVEGQHLTAKEYLRADRPYAPRHEYDALCRVQALHLAPEPVFFEPSVGPVVVYRYMEGEMWDRRVPSLQGLRALAELWVDLHSLGADAGESSCLARVKKTGQDLFRSAIKSP